MDVGEEFCRLLGKFSEEKYSLMFGRLNRVLAPSCHVVFERRFSELIWIAAGLPDGAD